MDISDRQRLILKSIILLHTNSGDPVGSKILNEFLDDLQVSTATLRNEMAEMTLMGLLEQPHTSAGRIPTLQGYRYYVDNLMRPVAMTKEEMDFIKERIDGMDTDPDKAAEAAAEALCEITGLASITTTPAGGDVQITHFEVMRTGRFNLAIMGVTGIGGVRTRVCRTSSELTDAQIETLESVLNDHMVFVSHEDVTPKLISMINAFLGADAQACAPAVSAAAALIKSANDVHVFSSGQEKLLEYREFDSHVKELLRLFTDKEGMRRWLASPESIKIIVGDELGRFGLDDISMVVGKYTAAGGRYGALSVAGPVRMKYGFIVPRLKYFCDYMSGALTNPA